MADRYTMQIRNPQGIVIAHSTITAAVADLLPDIVAMPHAYDALSYVAAHGDEGPSCGCGDSHWTCDYGDGDNDEEDDDDDDDVHAG